MSTSLAISDNQTTDPLCVYNFQKELLKRISSTLSSSNAFDIISSTQEAGSTDSGDSISSLYKLEKGKAEFECDDFFHEADSRSETIKYFKISTLIAKIDKFNNYEKGIYDSDIPVGPNRQVIDIGKELAMDFVSKGFFPFRVTPSIEEGLCMAFKADNILAYLELYNDGEIGLIAENTETNKVLLNIDLTKESIIPTLIKLFQ